MFEYVLDNAELDNSLITGLRSIWNKNAASDVKELISRVRPDVLKVDNYHPRLSPSVFAEAKALGVPTVLSVRNYRLICPAATLFRDEMLCTLCRGKHFAYPGIQHRCYRGSYLKSTAVAVGTAFSHLRGTWSDSVDRYLAVSDFVREQLILGGFPKEKVMVKPNFIRDTGPGEGQGGFVIYVGRLTEEKGVRTLLRAWQAESELPLLKIIGDGPLEGEVGSAAATLPNLEFVGRRPLEEVCDELGRAACLVFPSEWYEPFGRTIIEAYAKATPVVAARTPPIEAMVKHNLTGILFTPGDSGDLKRNVLEITSNGERLQRMRHAARLRYLAEYTEDVNYRLLMGLFESLQPINSRPSKAKAQ